MLTQVTTWFLEMTSPEQLRPSRPVSEPPTLMRVEVPTGELCRVLYQAVGSDWYWIDRLGWSRDDWQAWAELVETWVAYLRGTPAGYFELQPLGDGVVNLALFGLLPWAIGRGLGGWLLTRAVERCWELGPERVTLNTCSLDGPHALANYQARGFVVTRILTSTRELPEQRSGR